MRDITSDTRLVALLGHPVRHSLSPQMQNAAFQALDIDFAFVSCDVDHARVDEAVLGLRALDFAGANVTMPHKQAVMRRLDELSDTAQRIGAVNTIVHHDGALFGDNTDAIGIRRSVELDLGVDIRGKRCVILGAGGVARAVLVALADGGAAGVTIVNRTVENAQALLSELAAVLGECPCTVVALDGRADCTDALAGAELVVNCTSAGMQHGESPVEATQLSGECALYDTIYVHETDLVRDARARGINAVTGEGMLVHQGAAAFAQWTGLDAPVEVMRRALDEALAARATPADEPAAPR